MARRSRFALGGSFRAVRSLVSFLKLRGSRSPRIGQGLNYTKTWDASPYMTGLWVKYLKGRPEYNAGWYTMVNNMISEIEDGGALRLLITKNHGYSPQTGVHSVSYDIDYLSNLKNQTNHPDLMSEYISNMEDILRDYVEAYRDSEGTFSDASEEWGTRKAALEKYQNDVEDLMDEID
jgi:hypothetical protein